MIFVLVYVKFTRLDKARPSFQVLYHRHKRANRGEIITRLPISSKIITFFGTEDSQKDHSDDPKNYNEDDNGQ